MTETDADWVERPKPTAVAARTTRAVPRPSPRRDRALQQPSASVDPRIVGGGVAAAVALVAALLLRRRRSR